MGEKDGNMVTGNGRIFLLHGNAGSSIMFLYFSKKRKGFWLRVGASAIMLFLASLLIYPYFVDITNIDNWIWFIFIFALTIVICYFLL